MRSAVLLVDPLPGWTSMVPELAPGAHVVTILPEAFCFEGRQAGLELRDTLLVLSLGPRCRYAILWRAPSPGTVVEQVATTGTGGINVDACRIGTTKRVPGGLSRTAGTSLSGSLDGSLRRETGEEGGHNPTIGRWPPNVLFVHGPECQRLGMKNVRAHSGGALVSRSSARDWRHSTSTPHETRHYANQDGLETIPSWSCQPGCPVGLLDAQTGLRPSTLTGRADPTQDHANPGDNHGHSLFGGGNSRVYADQGGASRFYPQFANDEELFEWLKRLLGAKDD